DVNPLQYSLLRAWLGDAGDLCVVGDPDQAIYGWNGANPELLNEFATTFRAGRTLRLIRNHRSTPQILEMATSVLNRPRDFEAMMAPGPIPTVTSHEDDRAEARAVARAVRDNHAPGTAWSDQAVLARTNGQLPIIEETLGKLGIPCRTRGGAGLLSRPEIKRVLKQWSADDRPLPLAIRDLEEQVRELRAASMGDPDLVGAGHDRVADYNDDDGPVGEIVEQANNLETLVRVANDHLSLDPGAYADRFTRWAHATFDHESGRQNAVELMTFHAAKGLEWPVVHLVGFEDGLVPIGHARSVAAQHEERRLAYVAMTRAERVLSIHWARQRTFGTRSTKREPSPYIESMLAASDALARGERPVDSTDHIRALRRSLEEPTAPAADDGIVVALKEWRLRTARAADVPAYVILHDTTIGALAEQRPTRRSGLSSIPGIGPAKLDRYGDAILEIVAASRD
ncbi:MAG: ATP-dependent DNA helicase UvrD2, partial [Acidobacteria bacterium]|nr:ATP-dependent DNA helicase UvrD2 [Acidobacteriota bacterium]